MTPEFLSAYLENLQMPAELTSLLGLLGATLYLLVLALLANFIAKRFIAYVAHPLIEKTAITWDDLLIEHNVLVRFSHIVPAAIVHFVAPTLFEDYPALANVFSQLVNVYLIVIVLLVIDATLNFLRAFWERSPAGQRYPAKSFVQAAKLVINLIGLIFILATIIDRSPIVLFSGLGAVTAILLLIFKDAILGLVAGFQLSINNMVMVGDWIAMPARGADGDVIDVSLTTVKVKNWDKTITTIPTYALITDSFKNWRGMKETGGRRVKRPLLIDLRTLRFTDEAQLEKFKRIHLLRPYLESKLQDIQKHNESVGEELSELINGRRLTNIGTFRAYCVAYLRQHPKVRQDLTLLVRQLAPDATGLPIEIYFFCNDTNWVSYEDVQSDVFDHLLSILPEFGLSAFQSPSGADLEKAGIAMGKNEVNA
ncbi:MAG: mechanosensitive ion channel [Verrucomicrobia bacterium]|jgi:miniconductance mechanosensitive channel|nr:mechanosensitive ion channel [Verrucomicrobiota bacterium]